jgi:hydroxyacylglutathione hydrolase
LRLAEKLAIELKNKSQKTLTMIKSIHPIPAFTDNYIWALHASDSNQLAVVDPGDAAPVVAYMQANGLQLSHVLITHHHPDPIGGLQQLKSAYDPVVYGPEPSGIAGITDFLHEGDSINLFGHVFDILEVPGHTLDHIAYSCQQAGQAMLFCGDTLFAAGCGRLFEGTPAMMVESLAKLSSLDPATRVYCTHEYTLANLKFASAADGTNEDLQRRISREEEKRRQDLPTLPSTIELELATNPFLRCSDSKVVASIADRTGMEPDGPVEVFAALRSWKDKF